MNPYEELKRRLAHGWNTWNTRSVLSHVRLPEGFAINLGLKEYADGQHLQEALIGRLGEEDEQIAPGPRTYDGAYTELTLTWREIQIQVQTATAGDDQVMVVTPLAGQTKTPLLVVEAGMLWNRSGFVIRDGDGLVGHCAGHTFPVYVTATPVDEPYILAQTPYLALPLTGPLGISIGTSRTLDQIQAIVAAQQAAHQDRIDAFAELAEVYTAVQTCMAWDTVYDPLHDRVITPVSRLWNCRWGGYVLFCWDNYFAAYLASLDNRDLAYANAVEITREATERGFVPNFAAANGVKSRDRSQPPVGSLVVRELYRKFRERWLVDELFEPLLTWNRWWEQHRNVGDVLAWGSDPYQPLNGNYWETVGVNDTYGGALESGLDNSPMYDDIPFDRQKHVMRLADAGLTGLYVMDCQALADLARVLGRPAEAGELRRRADTFARGLANLWSDDLGIFLNRRTDSAEFSHRLSPTCFYPLLGRVATQAQAERMVADHLYNPAEFWGDWVLPSIARNDPAYPEQDYWRGRIWAPMNFLVYLGLRRYDLPQAQGDLCEKSRQLLLKEWREHHHVHENYCADTGQGDNRNNSDRFYHWGGLLGLIAFIEEGHLAGPENPLQQE